MLKMRNFRTKWILHWTFLLKHGLQSTEVSSLLEPHHGTQKNLYLLIMREFLHSTTLQEHRNMFLQKALKMEQGTMDECIPSGSYIRAHIMEVPVDVASKICSLAKTSPVLVCGLMQHESKMSVLHFSIKKHDTYNEPIKAKEPLIFNVGFRQFIARPVFSSDAMNSDKHKMERFLHPGHFSMASVCAPILFPPRL